MAIQNFPLEESIQDLFFALENQYTVKPKGQLGITAWKSFPEYSCIVYNIKVNEH